MKACTKPGCERKHQAKGLCHKHYMNQYYLDHPESREKARQRMSRVPKPVSRDRQLRHYYGVGIEWYEKTLADQDGVCAICRKPESKSIKGRLLKLAVDHCHDTLVVRGLLCQACNRGIGCFGHDIETLERAIKYLQAYKPLH